jgi:hypothetical protein
VDAGSVLTGIELEKFFDFFKSEPGCLGLFDEAKAAEIIRTVTANADIP